MRWIWIDKFVEFESCRRAVAVKNLTLAEEHLHDHFPGYPIMPASLITEGMAQTAGILVGEAHQFQEKVILAKIRRAVFHGYAVPGDQLRYEATIEIVDEAEPVPKAGCATTGKVFKNGQAEPMAEIDIMFSHIDQNMSGLDFPEENFVFTEDFKALLHSYNLSSASTAGPSQHTG
ncbi:MAG: beta-hydroxyacyl-ACP dehydratase [Phycisphaerae bacterium]|nr:beta-hydroxyacyl-ACP dehydratase [Phycisphaerae bacterium]